VETIKIKLDNSNTNLKLPHIRVLNTPYINGLMALFSGANISKSPIIILFSCLSCTSTPYTCSKEIMKYGDQHIIKAEKKIWMAFIYTFIYTFKEKFCLDT
jgi:hypothetical protein